MTKCPHCQAKLFHEKIDCPHHTKDGLVDQYKFKCHCKTYPNIFGTLSGYTKTVDQSGNLIHISIVTEKFNALSIYQPTQKSGLNFTPGTYIYSVSDHTVEKSSIKYKSLALALRLPQIKDLSNIDIKKFDSWCATMVTFA